MSDNGRFNMDHLRGWLTVPQILEDLQVTAEEWSAWRTAGETPAHFRLPDGTLRVNSAEYALWLEDRAADGDSAPAPEAPARVRLSLVPPLAACADAAPEAGTGTDASAPVRVRLSIVPPARGGEPSRPAGADA